MKSTEDRTIERIKEEGYDQRWCEEEKEEEERRKRKEEERKREEERKLKEEEERRKREEEKRKRDRRECIILGIIISIIVYSICIFFKERDIFPFYFLIVLIVSGILFRNLIDALTYHLGCFTSILLFIAGIALSLLPIFIGAITKSTIMYFFVAAIMGGVFGFLFSEGL